MKLQAQLISLTAVIGALLIAFATFNAARDVVYLQEAHEIETVADISDRLIYAAGSFAVERGTTAGILGAGGKATPKQTSTMESARNRADGLIQEAIDAIEAAKDEIHITKPQEFEGLKNALVELQDYRRRVDAVIAAGTTDADAAIASIWFPFITDKVIMASAHVRADIELHIQAAISSRVAEAFIVQEELFVWAEWAGRERGMLNGIIARNELIPFETMEKIFLGIGHIEAAIDLIGDRKSDMPPEVQETFTRATELHKTFAKTAETVVKVSGISPYPVTPAEWWEQASEVINTVLEARTLVHGEILAGYKELIDTLWLDFYLMSALLIFSIGVVAFAFFFIRNGVARPLQQVIDAQLELAGGNLEVWVPEINKDNEIGELTRSLYKLKQESRAAERYRREQEEYRLQVEREQRELLLRVANEFEASVGSIINTLASSSTELAATAKEVAGIATQTSGNAAEVGSLSNSARDDMGDVVTATSQLNDAIAEVAEKVTETSRQAHQAAEIARDAASSVAELNEASAKIRDVTTLISDIAEQTNLLALNATIEAARAGEAGKGFAVVASEVKNLATQTQKATEEIGGQVNSMLSQIQNSVTAVQKIREAVEASNENLAAIAGAAEEQSASTDGISQAVNGTAEQIASVVDRISEVNEQSAATSAAATQMTSSAEELARSGETLGVESSRFLAQIRGSNEPEASEAAQ